MYTPIFLINAGYLKKKFGVLPKFIDIIKMRIWLAKKQYELDSLKMMVKFHGQQLKLNISVRQRHSQWKRKKAGRKEGRNRERWREGMKVKSGRRYSMSDCNDSSDPKLTTKVRTSHADRRKVSSEVVKASKESGHILPLCHIWGLVGLKKLGQQSKQSHGC